MSPNAQSCPSCGQASEGKFCSNCGSPLTPSNCPACRASLGAGARFCHACGHPLGARARTPRGAPPAAVWIVAAAAAVLILGTASIVNGRSRATPPAQRPTVPGAPPSIGATAPPDISSLTPRERADRLFDRIMQAAEAGDTTTVRFFQPMAVSAYDQLPALDTDARYHLGLIHTVTGNRVAAGAQLDTLRSTSPNHLLATMLAFTLAQADGDQAGMRAAYVKFLNDYATEVATGLQDYQDHRQALDLFREAATARAGVN